MNTSSFVRRFLTLNLTLIVIAVLTAGCGGGNPPATMTPAEPEPTPTDVSTAAPTEMPTAAPSPTLTESVARPTDTPSPSEQTFFNWAPGGGTIDSNFVDYQIVPALKEEEGILGGYGDESGIQVQYDPTVITIEEIVEAFDRTGYPVVNPNE